MDVLDGIQSVVVSVAAGTGAWMAVLGVNTWRKQMRGKTEYEIARRCLRNAYRVRDALRMVRNPMITGGEQEHAVKDREDKPADVDERARFALHAAYDKRWARVDDANSDLRLDVLEAEVLWPEIQIAAKPLSKCVQQLGTDLSFFMGGLSSNRPRLSDDRREKIERGIFWQGSDDPFDKGLWDAVQKMEDLLAPHVRS